MSETVETARDQSATEGAGAVVWVCLTVVLLSALLFWLLFAHADTATVSLPAHF